MTDDVVNECYVEETKAWKAEVDRRLREALARLHASGAPDPTQEDIWRIWQQIALQVFVPTGKPQ